MSVLLDTKADYQRAEREALRLLKDYGFTEPPVNPRLVAYALEVKVTFVRFSGKENEISGFFDYDDNEIVVNEEEFPLRQTFTIAHELGHKLLHDEWAKSASYRVLPRDTSQQSKDSHEREADAFAANLLMPRFMLDAYMDHTPVELARLFAVSVPAMKNRLAYLYGY